MDKTYKCYFCAYDRPLCVQPNDVCRVCKRGVGFSLKRILTPREEQEWLAHQKLDKYIEECGVETSDLAREFIHRLIEDPGYGSQRKVPYAKEIREMRRLLIEKIRSVNLEKEK